MRAAAAVAVVVLGFAAGAAPVGSSPVLDTGCASTLVHYRPQPRLQGTGLGGIPWIVTAPGGAFSGHLFYYSGAPWGRAKATDLRIYSGGSDGHGLNMKILWRPLRTGSAATVSIVGAQLDGSASFAQRFPTAGGGFPSGVNIPAAGCWLLTVRSGRLIGTVVAKVMPPQPS